MSAALASLQARPAQRLRVQAVLALSARLIRGVGGMIESEGLGQLMAERRRLLRELRNGIHCSRELGCFEAMQAAVEESDRALRRIMEQSSCTKASTPLS
jgi:hypothetical protein